MIEESDLINETKKWISQYNNIMVSVSGGADSDMVLDIVIKACDDLSNIHFVFFDTGIEYAATLSHLDYLESKYGITIERVKPVHNVPYGATHDGVPFISKYISENINRLQSRGFDWSDRPFDELMEEYPKCKSALRWWCNEWGPGSRFNISNKKYLKEFLIAHPPEFNISAECCTYAKKDTASDYCSAHSIDLVITGIRKSEGGVRAVAYNSSFNESEGIGYYRPLWWVTNDIKDKYCEDNNVVHSECYTKYGMSRTGCAGCPFDKFYLSSLQTLRQYEPALYKTVKNLFGKSYKYTNDFLQFAHNKKKGKTS